MLVNNNMCYDSAHITLFWGKWKSRTRADTDSDADSDSDSDSDTNIAKCGKGRHRLECRHAYYTLARDPR